MRGTELKFDPKRLKAARGDRSYTQIAAAVGVTEQTVRNWESGRSEPDVSRLAALANATGRAVEFFFQEAAS